MSCQSRTALFQHLIKKNLVFLPSFYISSLTPSLLHVESVHLPQLALQFRHAFTVHGVAGNMSEVQNTPAAAAPVEATTASTAVPVDAPAVAERVLGEPVVDAEAPKVDAETAAADTTTAPTDTAVTAEEPAVAEKVVEPITEGQLAYKGPGLVKCVLRHFSPISSHAIANTLTGLLLHPRRSSGLTTLPSRHKTSTCTFAARSQRSHTPLLHGRARPARDCCSSTRRTRRTGHTLTTFSPSTRPLTSRRSLPTHSPSRSAPTLTPSRPQATLSVMAGTSPSRRPLRSERRPRRRSLPAKATLRSMRS